MRSAAPACRRPRCWAGLRTSRRSGRTAGRWRPCRSRVASHREGLPGRGTTRASVPPSGSRCPPTPTRCSGCPRSIPSPSGSPVCRLLDDPFARFERGPLNSSSKVDCHCWPSTLTVGWPPQSESEPGDGGAGAAVVGTVVVAGDREAIGGTVERDAAMAGAGDDGACSADEVAGVTGSVVVGTLCSACAPSGCVRVPEDTGGAIPPARTAVMRIRLTRPSTTTSAGPARRAARRCLPGGAASSPAGSRHGSSDWCT